MSMLGLLMVELFAMLSSGDRTMEAWYRLSLLEAVCKVGLSGSCLGKKSNLNADSGFFSDLIDEGVELQSSCSKARDGDGGGG
jgi:hypothetical protein